ncbi:MAG: rhodanese-like domain-containing protein [Pseudomonadota bacterium]
MNLIHRVSGFTLLAGMMLSGVSLAEHGGNITASLHSVDVVHKGQPVQITRTTDREAVIPKEFSRVGRKCPPFCLQPMQIAEGVETVGEIDVLGYLKRLSSGDRTVLVVDSRTPEWVMRGTIPGSMNIPWNQINHDVEGTFAVEAEAETLDAILANQFGVKTVNGKRDFRNARTLVLFCNGNWCPQSSINIKTLLKLGYPAYKLKWYRGGMQSWVGSGLTVYRH